MAVADAFIEGDDGDWTYLGKATINPCQVPGCPWPSTWSFHADGPPGAFEVIVGLLVEPGDHVRLCDHHAVALRDECWARDDAKVNHWNQPEET